MPSLPICSNIFPLSVIMKHLFCINIHESWSLHLIDVIDQYAKHFIFCIISEYSGKLWTGCPWWSASSGSSATSPQFTFSRFHQLEGGACSDLLSCNSPKATISEDKIDLKANLWFQVFNAKQIIISVSLICVKLSSNFQSILQPTDSSCLLRHMLRHHRARSHQHQALCQGEISHLCLKLNSILNRLTLEEVWTLFIWFSFPVSSTPCPKYFRLLWCFSLSYSGGSR